MEGPAHQTARPARPGEGGLRVGLFTDTYSPQINGVVTSVRGLAAGLRELGHEVTIVAPYHPRQQPEAGVVRLRSTVYRPEPEQRMAFAPSPRKLLLLRRLNLDLIHTHGSFTLPVIGLSLARSFGLPLVHTYHTRLRDYIHYYPGYQTVAWLLQSRWYSRFPPAGRVSARLRLGLERGTVSVSGRFDVWFANRCEVVIAPTEPIAAELRQMGVRSPVTVIPSGIDLERLTAPRPDPYQALGLPGGAPRLLTVSRLGLEKGVNALLERFALVRQAAPGARLVVVGDGPERSALEARAAALGLGEAALFVGAVAPADVGAYYQHADLFVFASLTETQGLVGLEAAACGLPVVARARLGIVKAVLDGVTGFLVEPDDAPAFAARALELLGDAHRRRAFSRASARWASEEWGHRRMTERVVPVYRRAIRGFVAWDGAGALGPPPED